MQLNKNDAETFGHFFLSLPSDKISASLIHADKAHESIRVCVCIDKEKEKEECHSGNG